MSRPRLLLIASFTELEWAIRPLLEEWAEVASFDMPGMGATPLPPAVDQNPPPERMATIVDAWRDAAVERGLAVLDDRGWDEFVAVTDSHGSPTAVQLAGRRRPGVRGLAFGHASLSRSTEGDRAPMRREVWDALGQLARQGSEAFVKHGIAQMTQGGYTEEVAEAMIARFPHMDVVADMIDSLGQHPEPIGEELASLDVPLLLAKHEGCLARTDEGFEDICAAFPEAATVICPEPCTASPAFAEAIRALCGRTAVS